MLLSCFVSTWILLFSVLFLCRKPNDFTAILPPSEHFTLRRLESRYTKGHYLCWIRSRPFSVVRRALFVTITVVPVALIQCYRTWVGKILRHVGRSPIWQCLFKIKTGNVRISFPNDLRELHCPYLTRGSAKYPFQFQRNSSTINAHKYSFFVRTVPAWNALSPASVCADSVAVFHSRSVDDFYLFYYFFFCCIKNHEYSLRFKKTIL